MIKIITCVLLSGVNTCSSGVKEMITHRRPVKWCLEHPVIVRHTAAPRTPVSGIESIVRATHFLSRKRWSPAAVYPLKLSPASSWPDIRPVPMEWWWRCIKAFTLFFPSLRIKRFFPFAYSLLCAHHKVEILIYSLLAIIKMITKEESNLILSKEGIEYVISIRP